MHQNLLLHISMQYRYHRQTLSFFKQNSPLFSFKVYLNSSWYFSMTINKSLEWASNNILTDMRRRHEVTLGSLNVQTSANWLLLECHEKQDRCCSGGIRSLCTQPNHTSVFEIDMLTLGCINLWYTCFSTYILTYMFFSIVFFNLRLGYAQVFHKSSLEICLT